MKPENVHKGWRKAVGAAMFSCDVRLDKIELHGTLHTAPPARRGSSAMRFFMVVWDNALQDDCAEAACWHSIVAGGYTRNQRLDKATEELTRLAVTHAMLRNDAASIVAADASRVLNHVAPEELPE